MKALQFFLGKSFSGVANNGYYLNRLVKEIFPIFIEVYLDNEPIRDYFVKLFESFHSSEIYPPFCSNSIK